VAFPRFQAAVRRVRRWEMDTRLAVTDAPSAGLSRWAAQRMSSVWANAPAPKIPTAKSNRR
jgi:hypothetical protein